MLKINNQTIKLVKNGLQWNGSKDTVARSLSFSIVYQPMDKSLPAYQVKKGDKVITSKYSGTEVKLDGVEYSVVRQGDILAVVED